MEETTLSALVFPALSTDDQFNSPLAITSLSVDATSLPPMIDPTSGGIKLTSSTLMTQVTTNNTMIVCRCRCCTGSKPTSCTTCCGNSPTNASSSCSPEVNRATTSSTPPSSTITTKTTSTGNLVAAEPLVGSRFPQRLRLNSRFLRSVVATEQVFELPVEEQKRVGFSLSEMLVGCTFDGSQCVDRYLPAVVFSVQYGLVQGAVCSE